VLPHVGVLARPTVVLSRPNLNTMSRRPPAAARKYPFLKWGGIGASIEGASKCWPVDSLAPRARTNDEGFYSGCTAIPDSERPSASSTDGSRVSDAHVRHGRWHEPLERVDINGPEPEDIVLGRDLRDTAVRFTEWLVIEDGLDVALGQLVKWEVVSMAELNSALRSRSPNRLGFGAPPPVCGSGSVRGAGAGNRGAV